MTTIHRLCQAYLQHADGYYLENKAAVRHIKSFIECLESCGWHDQDVTEFGPKALKTVRQQMIDGGWTLRSGAIAKRWTRAYINAQVNRLRTMFRWAVSEEIIQEATYSALMCVDSLRVKHTLAKEGKRKVHSAPQDSIDAIMPLLNERTRDMVKIQLLSAMRSGELCKMRPCDIKRREPNFWTYEPEEHKTATKGKERVISFGPRAIAILKRWMPMHLEQRLFPIRTGSYWMAIKRACDAAGVPHLHPHQFRHTAATNVRREFGSEAAQIWLDHSHLSTSDIYGERDLRVAANIAAKVG